jgi:hypothetical protein
MPNTNPAMVAIAQSRKQQTIKNDSPSEGIKVSHGAGFKRIPLFSNGNKASNRPINTHGVLTAKFIDCPVQFFGIAHRDL